MPPFNPAKTKSIDTPPPPIPHLPFTRPLYPYYPPSYADQYHQGHPFFSKGFGGSPSPAYYSSAHMLGNVDVGLPAETYWSNLPHPPQSQPPHHQPPFQHHNTPQEWAEAYFGGPGARPPTATPRILINITTTLPTLWIIPTLTSVVTVHHSTPSHLHHSIIVKLLNSSSINNNRSNRVLNSNPQQQQSLHHPHARANNKPPSSKPMTNSIVGNGSAPRRSISGPSTTSAVSPMVAVPISREGRVVFVDPDDDDAPWWWPALVVPPSEFEKFKKSVDSDVTEPKDGEYLVCYFEDGSFSIIPETDAVPFNPLRPPYTLYVSGPDGPQFKADNAVRLATQFWDTGIPPPSFRWLHDHPSVVGKKVGVQSVSAAKKKSSGKEGKKRGLGEVGMPQSRVLLLVMQPNTSEWVCWVFFLLYYPLKRSRSASPIRMTECGCGGEEGFEGVCGGCGGERKVVESPVGEEEGEKKEEDEDGDLLKPPVVPSTPGMSIPAVMPPTVHGVPMLPYQSVAQAATRQVRVVQQQQQQQGVAVVRRWERGEPTMLKDLMPVSKKRRWIERYQAVQRVNPLAVRHVDASPPPPPPIPVPVPTVVPMVVVEMEVETREEEEEEEEVVVEGAPVAGVEDTEMDVKESMSPVPVSAPVTSEDPEVEKEVDEGRGDTVAEDVEMEGEGGVDGDVGEGDVSEGVVEVKSGEDGSYPTPPIEVQRKSVDVGEVRKREEEEVASVDAVQGIE
ncbi:hypothetical protein BC829DRAFT_455428 [Chytridium lagenaria]|nr:hypothetical protein BC829DRAFT_455428 [Chytridium lagenaria]